MDPGSDSEANNWSDNVSTASNLSENSHEDNIYRGRYNNKWFNRQKIYHFDIWDWDQDDEYNIDRFLSENAAESWHCHFAKPIE